MPSSLGRTGGPVKYLMLIFGNEAAWQSLPESDLAALIGEVDAFNEALRRTGELVSVDGLVPRPRTVRMDDGAPIITDGPYLEAKEFVGSYFIVDVGRDERAVDLARSYPGLRYGAGVELWPLLDRGEDVG